MWNVVALSRVLISGCEEKFLNSNHISEWYCVNANKVIIFVAVDTCFVYELFCWIIIAAFSCESENGFKGFICAFLMD
jgi:hypothetical protein